MKVLFMADIMPNINSGAAGTECQTLKAISRLGADIHTVWAENLSHRIKHGNIHYLLELPYSLRNELRRKMRNQHYDVVHINQPHGYLSAIELKKEEYRKTVFVHRSHGFELRVKRDLVKWEKQYAYGNKSIVRGWLSALVGHLLDRNSRKIAEFADGHIVSASQCKDFLVCELNVSADRVAVIPQAPPDLYFQNKTSIRNVDRLKKILYVGQFAFVKAPMILAKVFSALSEKRKDLSFTWVCSQQHHAEACALLDSGIRDRVEFIDWLPQEKLRDVYDQHGLFLFPSFFEGFGKTFLEAMARGLCVVAADNGGMHDVIEHGVTGQLVPTGDCAAMVAACLDLIEHPDKSVGMSQKAMESAKQYTWQRVGQETLEFYEKLITKKLAR